MLVAALAAPPCSPTPGERQQSAAVAAAVADASQEAAVGPPQPRGRSASQPAELPSAKARGSADLPSSAAALVRSTSHPAQQQQQQPPGEEGEQTVATEALAQPPPQQQERPVDTASAAWQALLVPLAAVARLDVRPRVADAAAAVLLQIFKLHGDSWTPQQWLCLYCSVLLPLLALPSDAPAPAAVAARLDGAHQALSSPRTAALAGAAVAGASPTSSAGGAASSISFGEAAGARRSTTGGASALAAGALYAEGLPTEVPEALSFEGLDRCVGGLAGGEICGWRLAEGQLENASCCSSWLLSPPNLRATCSSSTPLHTVTYCTYCYPPYLLYHTGHTATPHMMLQAGAPCLSPHARPLAAHSRGKRASGWRRQLSPISRCKAAAAHQQRRPAAPAQRQQQRRQHGRHQQWPR